MEYEVAGSNNGSVDGSIDGKRLIRHMSTVCKPLTQDQAQLDFHSCDKLLHPYDPDYWLRRAKVQVMLGRPELVVGDAWKAVQLCRLVISSQAFQQGWRLGFHSGFWMTDEIGPSDAADRGVRRMKIQERFRGIEEEALRLQSQAIGTGTPGMGLFVPEQYPWLDNRHQRRSDDLLGQINKEFAALQSSCTAQRYALDNLSGEEALGVFASSDIGANELVLVDKGDIWGSIVPDNVLRNIDNVQPSTLQWLGVSKDEADQLLHLVSRSQNGNAARTMLKVRCLRRVVHDGVQHPLDHPILARLKPTYHRQQSTEFDLTDDIVIPNEALILFGIDIFAEEAFDTWVLYTIEARIDNNCSSNPTSACLAPLFALFNHSCTPNVRWSISASGRGVTLYADRDIQRGEQLFVTYNEYVHDQPVHLRQAGLVRWIDGGCTCKRCEDELKLAQDKDEMDQPAAQVMEWDCFPRPTLPEDALRDAG